MLDFPNLTYFTRRLSFCMHASTYEKNIEPVLAHKSKSPYQSNKIMIKIALFAYPALGRDRYIWTETAVQIRWRKAHTLGKKPTQAREFMLNTCCHLQD